MFLWKTRRDIEWFETSGVRESDDDSGERCKQQRFEDDGNSSEENLELFQNEGEIRVVEEFSTFSARSCSGVGEVERPIVWLALVDTRVGTVIMYSTKPETQKGQKLKLYADAQGKMLKLAVEQLIVDVIDNVQYWAGVR